MFSQESHKATSADRVPFPPVGQLELFVQCDTAVMMHEISQVELQHLQTSHSSASVKHIHHIDPEIPLQPLNIMLATMEHLKVRE